MVGFDEDVELGCNQDRICANYVRIGCLERGSGEREAYCSLCKWYGFVYLLQPTMRTT
jgi:hypothetical protein